ELVDLLAAAGCTKVGFGMETGDADRLRAIGKGLDHQLILAATRRCRQAGIVVEGFFILGHEDETLGSVLDTIRLAVALDLDVPVFGIMVPYPGTRVWDLALAGKGGYRRLSPTWRHYNKQIGGAVELERLPRRALELLQLVGYNAVFLANGRLGDW